MNNILFGTRWIVAILICVMATGNGQLLVAEEILKPSIEATSEITATEGNEVDLEDVYADLDTFASALTIIGHYYVEETSPRDIVYGALTGMLASLDPYSQFLDPEAHQDIKVETEGKFGGVGVEITFRDSVLTVIAPVDGTPASEAGVMPADKIVRIDGKSTRRMNLQDAVKLLRGEAGSEVKITVLRESEGRVHDFVLKRAVIKVKSVKSEQILGNHVGYVRITEFQENTSEDMRAAIKRLEKQKLKGLILDLRNNPGGLLTSAIKVAEQFVPRDELIVYTEGRRKDQDLRFVSKGVGEPKTYPIVVLINGGSASASEIVAGALKDHKLAIILGNTSFGKGSVQTVIPMRDGSAIRLTTSKYFTPSGAVIHGKGIEPDIEVPYEGVRSNPKAELEVKDKASEVFQKVKEMAGPTKEESEAESDTTKGLDNQILRALDLLAALDVYDASDFQASLPKD